MVDHKSSRVPPGNRQVDHIGEKDPDEDCGVTEEMFPCFEKCYEKCSSMFGSRYKGLCHCCSIWTSLPSGTNLVVTSIFECSAHGYGKRRE